MDIPCTFRIFMYMAMVYAFFSLSNTTSSGEGRNYKFRLTLLLLNIDNITKQLCEYYLYYTEILETL